MWLLTPGDTCRVPVCASLLMISRQTWEQNTPLGRHEVMLLQSRSDSKGSKTCVMGKDVIWLWLK